MGQTSSSMDAQRYNFDIVARPPPDDANHARVRGKRKAPSEPELADREEARRIRRQRLQRVKQEPVTHEDQAYEQICDASHTPSSEPTAVHNAVVESEDASAAQDDLMVQLLARFDAHEAPYNLAIQHLVRSSLRSGNPSGGKSYVEGVVRRLRSDRSVPEQRVQRAADRLLDAWTVELMRIVAASVTNSAELYSCTHSFFDAVSPTSTLLPAQWKGRLSNLLHVPNSDLTLHPIPANRLGTPTFGPADVSGRVPGNSNVAKSPQDVLDRDTHIPSGADKHRKSRKSRKTFFSCLREIYSNVANPHHIRLLDDEALEERMRQLWTSLSVEQQRAWRAVGKLFDRGQGFELEAWRSGAELLEAQGVLARLHLAFERREAPANQASLRHRPASSRSSRRTPPSSHGGQVCSSGAYDPSKTAQPHSEQSITSSTSRVTDLSESRKGFVHLPRQNRPIFQVQHMSSISSIDGDSEDDRDEEPTPSVLKSYGHVLIESFHHARDGATVMLLLDVPDVPVRNVDQQLHRDCETAFEGFAHFLSVSPATSRPGNKAWLVKFDNTHAAEQACSNSVAVLHAGFAVVCERLPFSSPKLFVWHATEAEVSDEMVARGVAAIFRNHHRRPASLRCQKKPQPGCRNGLERWYILRFHGPSSLFAFYLQLSGDFYAHFEPVKIKGPCVTCGEVHSLRTECPLSYDIRIPSM